MTTGARFRYPLEPVLLTRQWVRDALLADLSRVNASISAMRHALALLRRQSDDTAGAWNQRPGATNDLSPGAFHLVTEYLRDMARQSAARQATLDALELEAEGIVEKLAAAGRALQAVERHRDRLHNAFRQARVGIEFKLADEQWSARHAGATGDTEHDA